MAELELIDTSHNEMNGVPKYLILNAWKQLKIENMVSFKSGNRSHISVSPAGLEFLKQEKKAISLMEAVEHLYHH